MRKAHLSVSNVEAMLILGLLLSSEGHQGEMWTEQSWLIITGTVVPSPG